jgi:trans-2-enoyl-CoA reductase
MLATPGSFGNVSGRLSFVRFATTARAVVYSSYGNPAEKVRVFRHELPDPKDSQVTVKLLAAPINPADINQVEGVYPSVPPMTSALGTSEPAAVGGNEGVFEVVGVGSSVKAIKPGDWVLPGAGNFGTWRTHALVDESLLYKIKSSKGLSPLQAATVSVNPATAHQMLKTFVDLKEGDWFIQNGGNSGVGRAAIQLGRIWGLNSISVVRNRSDINDLTAELEALGATHVITEDQISDKTIKHKIADWTGGKPVLLGLNCVGGKSATNVARQLGHGGQLITYGGMSKQPLTFPTSLFIFKDFIARGYWLSEFSKKDPKAKMEVVEEILDLFRNGKLKDVPVTENVWSSEASDSELFEVFMAALDGSKTGKQVLVLN